MYAGHRNEVFSTFIKLISNCNFLGEVEKGGQRSLGGFQSEQGWLHSEANC